MCCDFAPQPRPDIRHAPDDWVGRLFFDAALECGIAGMPGRTPVNAR
jgi:hypothetical protein